MSKPATNLALEHRSGLPEALRVLLSDYPREAWNADPGFSALIRFWLERHLMFRRLLAALEDATRTALDGEVDEVAYARQVSRYGGMFVGDLQGHHSIEDQHYFPILKGLDARLEPGFDMLDRDHHALDRHLDGFVESANGVLREDGTGGAATDRVAAFHASLSVMERFLDRHLVDEEDLIVPVLLRHAPDGLV
ncbi:MAG: hemerythrin domain-containing protein [Silicimonas sp.]|nr:hemerythrin domain-containing protein [Silicimonas sp.]